MTWLASDRCAVYALFVKGFENLPYRNVIIDPGVDDEPAFGWWHQFDLFLRFLKMRKKPFASLCASIRGTDAALALHPHDKSSEAVASFRSGRTQIGLDQARLPSSCVTRA